MTITNLILDRFIVYEESGIYVNREPYSSRYTIYLDSLDVVYYKIQTKHVKGKFTSSIYFMGVDRLMEELLVSLDFATHEEALAWVLKNKG